MIKVTKIKKGTKPGGGKKYVAAFMAILMVLLMVPVVSAQTVERSSWYAGLRGSVQKDAPTYGSLAMGVSLSLGSGLYSIGDVNGGEEGGSGTAHVAKLFNLSSKFKGGFIAGAGIEFKPGDLPVNYAKGSAGVLGVLNLDDKNEKYGWLAIKRQSDLQSDNLFEARWDIAIGGGFRFGS